MTTTTTPRRKLSANRKRAFIAFALVMGLLIGCLSAELLLRVYVASRGWTPNCFATGLAFFVPDENAGYTLRPNLRLKSSSYDVTVNSHGIRGPEISAKRSAPLPRIAVLGGSSVFGYLVPDGEDSCRVLEAELRRLGQPCEVINAGVPGYNMHQCLARYQDLIQPFHPEVIILYLGWNDIKTLISDDPASISRTPPAPALWKRGLSHSALYGLLRYRVFPPRTPAFVPPASAAIAATEPGRITFETDFRNLVTAVQASGARVLIATQMMATSRDCSELNHYLGDTAAQIAANRALGQVVVEIERAVASEFGIEVIDCGAALDCEANLLGDAIHLTAEGHRRVAELWRDAVLRTPPVSSSAAGDTGGASQ